MRKEIRSYGNFFNKYLKPLKFQVLFLGIILASSIIITLIMPKILGGFIDLAKEGASTNVLISTAVYFMILVILKQLLELVSTYLSQKIGWFSTNQLRIDLIEKCLSLDISFHKKYKQGELIERIDGDVAALFNFFSKLLPNFLNNIVLIIGILIMIFSEGISIGIAISIFVAIAFFAFIKIQKKAVPVWVENRGVTSEFYGLLGESIDSRDDIRASRAVEYFMYLYHKFLRKLYKVQVKSELMFYKMFASSIVIFSIGGALAIGISGYFWKEGIISIGTVFVILNYTELLKKPIDQIRFQLEDLQKSSASIKRIEEIFSTKSQLVDGNNELVKDGAIAIDVRNIDFEYEDGKKVLTDISFNINKGKILGVLGRTGSGKTTLARLIARLYDPQQGEICFNGQNINSFTIKDLRSHVAYVTQDVQIFYATLRENMTLFNPYIEDNRIIKIMEEIGLGDWFKKLPNGLDTILKSEGGGISEGEAQLIAFVRVFLSNPSIVIMDEASSRLDPATERTMEKALEKLLKNRTCIIIAHRLSTIDRADNILILEDGIIVENGSRDQLVKDKNSKFYNLLNKGIEEVLI